MTSLRRELIAVAFFIFPNLVFAQWPLQKLSYEGYQYSAPDQPLLSKVKYSTNHYKSALFNQVGALPNDNISIDGLSTNNYGIGKCLNMGILRKDPVNRLVIIRGSWDDYGRDFETDDKDDYIVLGDNADNKDNTQLLLHKVDIHGQTLWRKLYGGSSMEYAVNIKKAKDGNFIVLAQTQSTDGDVLDYKGGKDIWLIKINGSNGDILWQKTFGSVKDETPTHLEILPDGSMVISGTAESSSFAPSSYNDMNAFLMKLDANANFSWIKVFGGNGNDRIKSFTPTDDGGFASIGTSTSSDGNYPVNLGGNDIYIFKHNSVGDIMWTKHYGNKDDDEAGDIVFTSCGSKIFASYAKQFSNDAYYSSTPSYPLFSQTAGVQIGIYNDGTQFYYHEDNFTYSTDRVDNFYFNEQIFPTLAPNDRGGFLGGSLQHIRYEELSAGSFRGIVTRSFMLEEYGSPLILTNHDTTICSGEAVRGINYFRDTTFSDTARNSCNIDTLIENFTIKVINNNDSIINKDTSICNGQMYEGEPVITSFAQYDTLFTNSKCGRRNIITQTNIFVPPLISSFLGDDTLTCQKSLLLNASVPGGNYLWQNGSTASTLLADSSGLYWAEVTDSYGCKKRDSITIRFSDLYLNIFHDTTILSHQSLLLAAETNGTVSWKPNDQLSCLSCKNSLASPLETTIFYLVSEKESCSIIDSVKVTIEKDTHLYIPSAFTPNNDGKNDQFKAVANRITDYKMQLFNRWGQLIFQSDNLSDGWNGNFKGHRQPMGVYVYVLSYKDAGGKMHKQKGTFMLLR